MHREFYALQKGSMTVTEYEMELNRLMKFALDAFKNDEEARIQRFLCGLGPRLQHEVSLEIEVNKALAVVVGVVKGSMTLKIVAG
ncbi:hypothetical protein DITRI_Ditri17bG0046900 [Diplodiscus trichospermus]